MVQVNQSAVETVDDDFPGPVSLRADRTHNPVVVAVFDGDERVSEWAAALQKRDFEWYASGYAKGAGYEDND